MADLRVDLDGLDGLRGGLDDIRATLAATRASVESARGDLGSAEVHDALVAFERHWEDGRERIDESASTLTAMLGESVRAYRTTDADLAAGLRTSAAPAAGAGGAGAV